MSETVSDKRLVRNPPTRQPATARLPVPPLGSFDRPNATTVQLVHRGPDGYVAFARRHDGEWEPLGAMSLREPWLPGLLDALDEDGYFGLNSSYRPARRSERPVMRERHVYRPAVVEGQHVEVECVESVTQRVSPVTGLPHAHHTQDNLRWLNVAHVDVDCYRVGLTVGDVLGRIVDLQDAGQLPPATAFARSGRGLWVFWFLLDMRNPRQGERTVYGVTHRPDTPQRASKRALALYAKVQRALAERLRIFGADLGALDGPRFAPVPGTRKTATDTRVDVWFQLASNGHGFAYTLPQLAKVLDVPTSPTAHPVIAAALPDTPKDAPKDAALSAAGRKGWLVRWRNTLADLRVLLNLRGGGFDAGCRNRGAFFYALVLLRSGMSAEDAASHLADYGAKCRPPLAADELRGALKQAQKPKQSGHLANERLFSELGVTDREASYLSHPVVRPPAPPPRQSPDARRARVLFIVKNLGHVPPTRAMSAYLKTHGFSANHATVALDYQALGLRPLKPTGGRPPKLPLA